MCETYLKWVWSRTIHCGQSSFLKNLLSFEPGGSSCAPTPIWGSSCAPPPIWGSHRRRITYQDFTLHSNPLRLFLRSPFLSTRPSPGSLLWNMTGFCGFTRFSLTNMSRGKNGEHTLQDDVTFHIPALRLLCICRCVVMDSPHMWCGDGLYLLGSHVEISIIA